MNLPRHLRHDFITYIMRSVRENLSAPYWAGEWQRVWLSFHIWQQLTESVTAIIIAPAFDSKEYK
jgi:hypothetical protein